MLNLVPVTSEVDSLTDLAKSKVELAKALLRAADNARRPKAKAKAAATKEDKSKEEEESAVSEKPEETKVKKPKK